MLSVLWDLEPEEVEDILEEFVNKSLLFVDSHNKPFLYYLHDLQLDFLVEQNRTQLEVSWEASWQELKLSIFLLWIAVNSAVNYFFKTLKFQILILMSN